MKAYTNIEQSKKLAEILPIESADMWYCPYPNDVDWHNEPNIGKAELLLNQLPCWSLATLLNVLPNSQGRYQKTLYWFDDDWHCEYVDENSEGKYGVIADNPIDACYKMILELNELNLL